MIDRRHILRLSAGGFVALSIVPVSAWADEPDMKKAIKELFGDREMNSGRLSLSIPALAENGYSVAMDVEVESPMTAEDYVKSISIFSDRNPIPLIAQYHFKPASGLAKVSSKVRLGGSQTVHAIAEMSDGSLWRESASTLVTLAACVTG